MSLPTKAQFCPQQTRLMWEGEQAEVVPLADAIAVSFILKWHYNPRPPSGQNIFFGWYIAGELYAVAAFGMGINPIQPFYLNRILATEILTIKNLLELKRLCRSEPRREDAPLTKFISLCLKTLRKRGYCGCVSFSDPAHGHNGGIYKAASFKYLGKTKAEWHVVDENGVERHRRFAYRYSRRHDISLDEARNELKLTRLKTTPKDRWFRFL